jgi:hypothetical protein
MQLKLKENPNEWRKFTLSACSAASLFAGLLFWRQGAFKTWGYGFIAAMVLAAVASVVRPSWFRGFYRFGMTAGHLVGRVMGSVMLTLFFFLALTPMGLLLRVLGKDLLQIKPPESAATYWQKAKTSKNFERQF